jgi:hypothetical protein
MLLYLSGARLPAFPLPASQERSNTSARPAEQPGPRKVGVDLKE